MKQGLFWGGPKWGNGELIVGNYDMATKEVIFDENYIKVEYVSKGRSEMFSRAMKYAGYWCIIQVGFFDFNEKPFYPLVCEE